MTTDNPEWFTAIRDHSGQKLAIRVRPLLAVSGVREKCGYLFVVTQDLASVRPDGMPEAEYNSGLAKFDCELIQQLEVQGRVVVVETFAGKRIYYAYVADENTSKDRATQVLSAFGHLPTSTFRGGADPTWQFYFRYCDSVGMPNCGA